MENFSKNITTLSNEKINSELLFNETYEKIKKINNFIPIVENGITLYNPQGAVLVDEEGNPTNSGQTPSSSGGQMVVAKSFVDYVKKNTANNTQHIGRQGKVVKNGENVLPTASAFIPDGKYNIDRVGVNPHGSRIGQFEQDFSENPVMREYVEKEQAYPAIPLEASQVIKDQIVAGSFNVNNLSYYGDAMLLRQNVILQMAVMEKTMSMVNWDSLDLDVNNKHSLEALTVIKNQVLNIYQKERKDFTYIKTIENIAQSIWMLVQRWYLTSKEHNNSLKNSEIASFAIKNIQEIRTKQVDVQQTHSSSVLKLEKGVSSAISRLEASSPDDIIPPFADAGKEALFNFFLNSLNLTREQLNDIETIKTAISIFESLHFNMVPRAIGEVGNHYLQGYFNHGQWRSPVVLRENQDYEVDTIKKTLEALTSIKNVNIETVVQPCGPDIEKFSPESQNQFDQYADNTLDMAYNKLNEERKNLPIAIISSGRLVEAKQILEMLQEYEGNLEKSKFTLCTILPELNQLKIGDSPYAKKIAEAAERLVASGDLFLIDNLIDSQGKIIPNISMTNNNIWAAIHRGLRKYKQRLSIHPARAEASGIANLELALTTGTLQVVSSQGGPQNNLMNMAQKTKGLEFMLNENNEYAYTFDPSVPNSRIEVLNKLVEVVKLQDQENLSDLISQAIIDNYSEETYNKETLRSFEIARQQSESIPVPTADQILKRSQFLDPDNPEVYKKILERLINLVSDRNNLNLNSQNLSVIIESLNINSFADILKWVGICQGKEHEARYDSFLSRYKELDRLKQT